MKAPTIKIYPSAAIEKNDLEERFKKKLNDVKSFDNSFYKIKKKSTYI